MGIRTEIVVASYLLLKEIVAFWMAVQTFVRPKTTLVILAPGFWMPEETVRALGVIRAPDSLCTLKCLIYQKLPVVNQFV